MGYENLRVANLSPHLFQYTCSRHEIKENLTHIDIWLKLGIIAYMEWIEDKQIPTQKWTIEIYQVN